MFGGLGAVDLARFFGFHRMLHSPQPHTAYDVNVYFPCTGLCKYGKGCDRTDPCTSPIKGHDFTMFGLARLENFESASYEVKDEETISEILDFICFGVVALCKWR